MNVQPSISAVRSIGVEFARRFYMPVVITVAIVAAVLLALSIWLVTLNEWWLILLILVCGLIVFATVLVTGLVLIIKKITPSQSRAQKSQTKAFVDKLMRVAEVTATPKFILLFQVLKDIVKPSKAGFISSVSNDTTSLKKDFLELKDSFK